MSMNSQIKTEISQAVRHQIRVMNGYDFTRETELRNARAVLCTLPGQDVNIALITRELEEMGAE